MNRVIEREAAAAEAPVPPQNRAAQALEEFARDVLWEVPNRRNFIAETQIPEGVGEFPCRL